MLRKVLSIFITAICLMNTVFAQEWGKNYAIKAAEKDAQNFVLNEIDLKKFKKDRSFYHPAPTTPNFRSILRPGFPNRDFRRQRDTIDYYSDWFKPTKATTSDTMLLKDSSYVQAYRAIAYRKTASRSKSVTTLGIVGIVIGGAVVIAGITAVFIAALNHVEL